MFNRERINMITKKAKIKAQKLHKAEHEIMKDEWKPHKDYYYYMASQLVEDLMKEIKEISKQQKYLWQTLEEVIEKLNKLSGKKLVEDLK
jgi:phosphodiesterase/alkaline phosphatase D-like protein